VNRQVSEDATRFGPKTTIAVGKFPLDVVAGDVDGDGAIDLLSADGEEGAISVLLGRGNGAFVPAPQARLPVKAHLLALADLDRDGDLDVVSTDHDSAGIVVWLGDGKGNFAAAPGSPFLAHDGSPHNHGLAVADISGDGIPDVVTSNQTDRSVSVMIGEGTGRLAPAKGSPLDVGAEPYMLRLGDMDGDGKLDIVAPLVSGSGVVVLRGDGSGGFAHAPGSPYATPARPLTVTIADVDGDSRNDVLAAHDDTDLVSILIGQSDENGVSFSPAEGSPMSLGTRVFAMTTADVDGNGVPDVIGGAGERVLVLLRDPDRALTEARREYLAPLRQSWTVLATDLDGDGHADVVAPDAQANTLELWLSAKR
jgi:hypothetical protein